MSYEMARLKARLAKAVAKVALIEDEIRQCVEWESQGKRYTKIEHRARSGWRGEISRS